MFARLRSIWFSINASYWFFPALFAALSFLLAVALVEFEPKASGWLDAIPGIKPASPDTASTMLSLMAGSMVAVASTVFSITIAAVAYASGTYGPRLLNNFMEDRGNQLSLATFIGTFVYALSVLHAVRGEDGQVARFVPQLALLAAYGLMMISVGVLVYFLHHIPSSIRINTVLDEIGERLLAAIAARFPDDRNEAEPPRRVTGGASVLAHATGYIRVIDYSRLAELAARHDTRIALTVRTGDFVHTEMPLVRLEQEQLEEPLAHRIRECFALGASRTPEQDLEFSIDELVEIALRALSPGVNDPFTAITAVHWLGAATGEIGRRNLRRRTSEFGGPEARLVPLHDDFSHFVDRGFGAARSAIAANRLAALVTLDTIASAVETIESAERRALLVREGALLLEQAQYCLEGPDLDEVRARHALFARRCSA